MLKLATAEEGGNGDADCILSRMRGFFVKES